jgi:hypothetical protein
LVYLVFSTSTKATFFSTNIDNGNISVHTGTVTTKAISSTAPASISGKTLTVKAGNNAVVTLNTDGTFNNNDSNGTVNSGTYTYTPYSPVGALLVLSITAGSDTGNTAYVIMTFTSGTAGSASLTSFDNTQTEVDAHNGTFTVQ